MIHFRKTCQSMSLWLGPLYWCISWNFPSLYHFHITFEVQDR